MGFSSQCFRPGEAALAAIVLCNPATANAERLARQVADMYLADRLTEPSPLAADRPPSVPRGAVPAPAPVERGRLAELAGRYFSDELDATVEFAIGDCGVIIGRRGRLDSPPTVFLGDDTFGGVGPGGGSRMRFRRDVAGRVDGFVLDAGRLRGLWFSRVQ